MPTSPLISVPAYEISYTNVCIWSLATLFIFYLFTLLIRVWSSPLCHIPGPLLARFTRLWEIYSLRKHDSSMHHIALHEKYGPIVRLAPNRYSFNDAEAVKTILGYKNVMDKSSYYYPFGYPDQYNTFSEPSTQAHANLRRPMAQLYSTTNLVSYEPFVDTCNQILVKRLEEHDKNKTELNVRELMQYYAFDVIGEITVGSRFGLLEENGDKSGILQAIDESICWGATVGLVPSLHWWMGKIGGILGLKPSVLRVKDFVDRHLNDRVAGRTKSPDDRQDFLDKMLPLEQKGTVTRLHTDLVCQQNIAAGSDTTAISLSAVIAYLSMYPEVLALLRQELHDAANNSQLSDPATYREAQRLPYLQAVILETLRIHPAVGTLMVRVVGQGGAHIAGQYFPPGTEVGINAWVIHNNRDIFGQDASSFRPERWLTDNSEERGILDRNFLAFGGGPRTCLGKNISFLEMLKVVPQIVRKFDFELLPQRETGELYTWKTRWFAKPSFTCLVRRR